MSDYLKNPKTTTKDHYLKDEKKKKKDLFFCEWVMAELSDLIKPLVSSLYTYKNNKLSKRDEMVQYSDMLGLVSNRGS